MRTPLVAGNWKMNGELASSRALASAVADGAAGLAGVEVLVCPPFCYLQAVAGCLADAPVRLGAQNMSDQLGGAFTGEISGLMLADFGCRYVILGHSERRHLYGETDELVGRKVARAVALDLVPIACVGETLAEREAGATEEVVGRQLDAILEAVAADRLAGAVIAYEPVWAIGTGRNATPEQAQQVHAFVRQRLSRRAPGLGEAVRVLYGGSVKPDNARRLFQMPDVDGGLVGGASLEADAFLAICRAAIDSTTD